MVATCRFCQVRSLLSDGEATLEPSQKGAIALALGCVRRRWGLQRMGLGSGEGMGSKDLYQQVVIFVGTCDGVLVQYDVVCYWRGDDSVVV